jgi:hypothetical protein
MLFLDQQKPPPLRSSNLFTAPANAHSRCRFFVFLSASMLPLALPPPPALGTQATWCFSWTNRSLHRCGHLTFSQLQRMHTVAVVSSSSSQRRCSHSRSLPHPRSARRPRGGAQAQDISDGGAVPGLSSSSAAPPPASHQSPRALASGPPHTTRRPCMRPYRLRWTIDGAWLRRRGEGSTERALDGRLRQRGCRGRREG